MNILAIGDLYGNVGKEMLAKHLTDVRAKYKIDFTIVNAENTTQGKSLNKVDYDFLCNYKIDCLTMGNHVWFQKEILEIIDKDNLLRPLNMNKNSPGKGSAVFHVNGKTVRVTNIIGRTFMQDTYENQFYAFEELLKDCKEDIHIVDFHGETTSEKIAFAWLYDGQFTAQVGSHTHVQTNDYRILPKGTGFITDIGMTGPYNSIIGAEPTPVINKLRTAMPNKFTQALGEGQFCAVVIEINDSTNKVTKMTPIYISPQRSSN